MLDVELNVQYSSIDIIHILIIILIIIIIIIIIIIRVVSEFHFLELEGKEEEADFFLRLEEDEPAESGFEEAEEEEGPFFGAGKG